MYCKHTSESTGHFTVEEYHTDRHYKYTNERNVQGTDITSEKNVQILYTQNQSTVQVFTKPVYSTCIHRICTGMEFNQQ